jgi:hypothetical protein
MVSMPAFTPVTTPPDVMLVLAFVVDHVPPVLLLVNVIPEPTQTLKGPEIVPALGCGLTVITLLAVSAPQTLFTIYLTLSKPVLTPDTIPPEVMVVLVFVVDHVPPVPLLVKVMEEPTHTLERPAIVPALG